jgi:uncharacterized membrane protein (TIGR02234 family)
LLLLAGAAGACVVLLAARQEFARVEVVPLHPLPVTITKVSGQDLMPALSALAIAALAAMAAVLATRGLMRRVTGLIAVLLGAGMAVTALGRTSKASVLAVVTHAGLSSGGAGASNVPGSTTAGTDPGLSAGTLAGFPAHVLFTGSGWRALVVAGAVIVMCAGAAVIVRAVRLPAMSSRYERTAPVKLTAAAAVRAARSNASSDGQRALPQSGNAARLWESLSAGADPTAGSFDD